ncbi:transporter substrate-binding domain-containing protein [Fusobacterium sp.]|uniref:transporter substrate-binding domain-containing protein n=1 Tax=Fusobacterium sp. TaxID=68766 RepID=UPI0026343538|nr:transporter substrate-binding domain-containing protein [Fusobacterium sp.]
MKKVLLVLTVLFVVLLGGCGSSKNEKVIRIGGNAEYKPYEYLEGNKVTGFSIDVVFKIFENLGYKIEYTNMSFEGLIPALETGKVDVLTGLTPTDERKKFVDFSEKYYVGRQIAIANKSNPIEKVEDLKNKKIGVQLGTLQETLAKQIEGADVILYNSFTGAIMDLNSQKIDAIIISGEVKNEYLGNNPKLYEIGRIEDNESKGIAIVFPKGQEDLIEKVNIEINKMKDSGELDKLADKYFGE